MENKLFKTDYTKKLYKIEIIVCQKQKEQVEQAEPRLLNCYEILGIKQPNKPNKNKKP